MEREAGWRNVENGCYGNDRYRNDCRENSDDIKNSEEKYFSICMHYKFSTD
jgi:hypothetical protein